jgi:hypothetical protein
MTKKRALVVIPLALLVGVVATVLLLAGRGGTPGSSEVAHSAVGSGGSMAEPPSRADAMSGKAPAAADEAVSVQPLSRAVISTGQVTLHTKQLSEARADVFRLVTSWDGNVADEQTESDAHGRITSSTMTLRVPSATFSQAMDALAGLGDVEQQSRKSVDVTTKVIDNDARVRAAERSIRQIESLLSRASRMGDIIAIENDLANRQADLDSLKSQQAYLADQTSLSTISLYLSRTTVATRPHETRGFLAGLEGGWTALGGAVVVVLTALGALLPFAILLALVGVPLWLVVRRRWARFSGGSAPARSA